jgi:tetratricopeptide (TPR) repeat protein
MMAGTQYERYKSALERGHVAALRGTLEDALAAYAEAASIVPGRAAPLTGAGNALLRRKRAADALRYFLAAMDLAPRDEAANLGRAQSLLALDRRAEAADAYDLVADMRTGAGKLAEAVDAACRALDLAEGRDRRRALRQLADRLRAAGPDERGQAVLDRAMDLLEPRPVAIPQPEPQPEPQPVPEPNRPTRPPSPLDRHLPPGLTLEASEAAAQAALDSGPPEVALERLLDLAAACRRDGRLDAALDACYRAVALDPDHIDLHLGMAELYALRGWGALATEKLDLVWRLAEIDGDQDALGRVAASREATS